MGGAARIIRRVFSPPSYTPPPAQTVMAAPVAPAVPVTTTISGASKMSKVRGAGSGITGTIMTDTMGLEDEANVAKTVLGEGKKKKKYA